MSRRSEQNLTDDESRSAAAHIAEELARRRMTRHLAELARISLSTLEKALTGRRPFTLATVVRLEQALGVDLRTKTGVEAVPDLRPGLAPDGLGSYSRPAVSWMEGDYLTLRPSFSEPRAIYAYLTQIRWDQTASNLVFTESERIDAEYTQGGQVSAPHQSGHIYLVTNKHGQYRMIIVARPTIKGEMHGILTTLQVGRGAQLTPVATPIVLAPVAAVKTPAFGQIKPGHDCYAPYRGYLKRTVDEPFALFMMGQ
jgi:transcriptional regulator with XRE-family HTH domain